MALWSGYQAPAALLQDRNILVTGAGDGIGRAAAECFAAHGARVILLGRNEAKLEAVYDTIVARQYPEPVIHALDLLRAGESDYAALASAIEQELGGLHGLLHNAALLGPQTPIDNYPATAWNELIQVNLTAGFLLSKALLPVLRTVSDASIIFTSSSVGRQARAFWGAYTVSKFGVEALSQVLAQELANTSRIRVNSLNPGPTNTAMRRAGFPAELPSSNPDPESLMNPYLYLMGPASIGVTGKSLDAQAG